MSVFQKLLEIRDKKGAGFLLLVDPDENQMDKLPEFIRIADAEGVDAFLVGASLLLSNNFEDTIKIIKSEANKPVIIFPGSSQQISSNADAILFLTLISSRNPEYLIGEQVKGAPLIKAAGIEPIPTGYILIESGRITSVQYVSNSMPIPSDKPDLVKVHALAAQYMGMRLLYLEAGSGALYSVPEEIITKVSEYADIPIIAGGGITSPEDARAKVIAGASFVVVGNFFEKEGTHNLLAEFSEAIHTNIKSEIEVE
ncbi:MAG TPA: geranylgeranylglyceryl/heptaprenylglyceryl phosphate synthase [candidate division Zixibacteria bacterium]|nr:geranylgeranylglyceryl/heptaprenylglyceryl phosphate synthase [candidate division Zixibacteria bacterium]